MLNQRILWCLKIKTSFDQRRVCVRNCGNALKYLAGCWLGIVITILICQKSLRRAQFSRMISVLSVVNTNSNSVQRQTAVTAYMKCEKLLLFAFAILSR